MMLFKFAITSLLHRKTTVLLTIISITISVAIVLSIVNIYQQARTSFTQTISGTDLIVGARGGPINLLLYSVFRIGNPTNNIQWESFQKLSSQPGVEWAIPISLGDSHKGFRVLATNADYFNHYRYGQKKLLAFKKGQSFSGVYDAVLGAEIAKKLNYELGDKIVLSHGVAQISLNDHADKPFTVVGILKPTGTPVDQTLHISLEGMEAIHIDWRFGAPIPGVSISAEDALTKDLPPKTITAMLIGLENKILTFRLQRAINNYKDEPLMAILPGVTLSELWQTMSFVEKLLTFIAALVVMASLLGTMTMMLSTLNQRQREIAILRACGAPAVFIFGLIQLEVFLISLIAIVSGVLCVWLGMLVAQPVLLESYGLNLHINPLTMTSLFYGAAVLVTSMLLGLIPAISAYRQSLNTGLQQTL